MNFFYFTIFRVKIMNWNVGRFNICNKKFKIPLSLCQKLVLLSNKSFRKIAFYKPKITFCIQSKKSTWKLTAIYKLFF